MSMKKLKISLTFTAVAAALTVSSLAGAGTIENLERERALTINTMLDPDMSVKDRQVKLTRARLRLIDLERMVLRDKKLTGRNTPAVRRAFENYDLTFLVHGATEKNMSVVDAWLNQLGVTTQSVLSATRRRR